MDVICIGGWIFLEGLNPSQNNRRGRPERVRDTTLVLEAPRGGTGGTVPRVPGATRGTEDTTGSWGRRGPGPGRCLK